MLRVEMLGKFRQHVQQLDAGSDLKPRRSWCCGDPSSRNGKVGGVSDNFDPTRSVRMFVGGRGHYALTALWSSTQNVAGSCISWVEEHSAVPREARKSRDVTTASRTELQLACFPRSQTPKV
jgi:hypothetical protein